MSTRNLVNLLLLVVIAGLVAIVVYEPGITPEPENPKLTSLNQDDVNHILIQRKADDDIELEKVNGAWQLLKPYQLPAHEFRAQSILRLAEAESLSQNDLAGLDKSTFGLDNPRAIVTFNQSEKILFGSNEPLQQHRYVQVGNTLHTIVDSFYYQVAAALSTYIDHRLLASDNKITRLELPELSVELKQGKWQLTPQPEDYSADNVTELLNNWRNAQAIEIAKTAKVDSNQVVKIYLQDKPAPLSYAVVKNEKGIALVRNDLGLAYSITEDSYNKLFTLPANKENSGPE